MEIEVKHVSNMEWGSYQYDTERDTYLALLAHEQKTSREETLKTLFGFTILAPRPIEQAWPEFKADMIAHFLEDYQRSGIIKELVENLDLLYQKRGCTLAMLHLYRDMSFDLWAAISRVVSFFWTGLELDGANDSDGELDIHGIGCWLLRAFGLVEDDEPFKEFDT